MLNLSACTSKNDSSDKSKETTASTTTKQKIESSSESAKTTQSTQTPASSQAEGSSQGHQEAQESETNTQQSVADNQNTDEARIQSDIYNRLVAARDAAIEHQNEWVEEGGSPNDVQSAVSAVISESTSLKLEYPQTIRLLVSFSLIKFRCNFSMNG